MQDKMQVFMLVFNFIAKGEYYWCKFAKVTLEGVRHHGGAHFFGFQNHVANNLFTLIEL